MKTGRQGENEIHPLLQRKPTYFDSDQRTTTTQSFICIYSFYKMYINKRTKKKMCISVLETEVTRTFSSQALPQVVTTFPVFKRIY